jgi:hypothetical protein
MLGSDGSRPRADRNGPRSGDSGHDGWAMVARDLSSGRSDPIHLPMSDLFRPPAFATVTPTPGSGLNAPLLETQGVFPLGRDSRALYPVFDLVPLDDELAITDWKGTSRSVTGSVVRDPVSTAAKAKLNLGVSLETPSVVQLAVVLDGIPSKLLYSIDAFSQFLGTEAQFALDQALDAHCISQILGAAPAIGEEGADMISKTRNAVRVMRGLGANPTVMAAPPKVASELDLTKTELGYVFSTRASGGASPLWQMAIVEDAQAGLTQPLLIDPELLGALYAGTGTILLDPYSGMSENLVRLRLEFDALFHVRQPMGAYIVGK